MLSCRPWIIKYISLKLTGTKTHPFPQHKMAINYYGRFLSEFYNDPKGSTQGYLLVSHIINIFQIILCLHMSIC